jgi:signal transduction histidine kinase
MGSAERGSLTAVVGDDGLKARSEMQSGLLRSFFWLSTLAAAGLTLRETLAGSPVLAAAVALSLAGGGLLLARSPRVPLRVLGLGFFCSLVLVITKAALDLGGSSGSALSFSFIPGFLAVLVLGPRWGWPVCGLMLASLTWLSSTTPLAQAFDRLRFIDEVAMAVFTAALAHSLIRTFGVCEAMLVARRRELSVLRDQRQAMTAAIYEQLEPLAAELVAAVPSAGARAEQRGAFEHVTRRLVESLGRAKVLARRDVAEPQPLEDPERLARRQTMRVWLRIGAVLMAFFALRNWWAGVAFVPSLFSLGFCLGFDIWLNRTQSTRSLEWTALAIGVLATGSLAAHVEAYGATPDAPALVVTPSTVLFTALLSRGPATWAVALLNVGILARVGIGQTLTLPQSRLLGDLTLSFVVVAIALRYVLSLRRRYARALIEQGRSLSEALRQHRKLVGTLFHDVSNHLQVLTFHVDVADAAVELPSAESLSRRIQRLISLSKEFLLADAPSPTLSDVVLSDTLSLLTEAFAPRLGAKHMRLAAGPGMELRVRAQPELLVESVLGNLLSNAVKFAPQGSAIELFAERSGPDVRIVLRDSGPGVPAELLQRLEQDEALPSKLGTDGERGQGYGLQLVREHLQRMGGKLELRRRNEGGTEAVILLQSA